MAFRERRRVTNFRSERIALASARLAGRRCACPAAACAWPTNVTAFVSVAARAASIGPDGTCACVVSTSAWSRHVTEENVGPVVQAGSSVVVVLEVVLPVVVLDVVVVVGV